MNEKLFDLMKKVSTPGLMVFGNLNGNTVMVIGMGYSVYPKRELLLFLDKLGVESFAGADYEIDGNTIRLFDTDGKVAYLTFKKLEDYPVEA